MGDSIFGFLGKDFVILVADTTQARSILVMKGDEDKIFKVDSHKLMAAAGPPGDRIQFLEYIEKNLTLYALRTGNPLSTKAAVTFTRGELASALRSSPYQVNILFGGYDQDEGPSLYFLDYLASLHKMNFACHGYAGYFLLSILDRHWKEGMTVEESLKLVKYCTDQLKSRFVLNSVNFEIKMIDKNGIQVLPNN